MSVAVRPLEERDIEAAEKVRRLAFGTYFGLPDPLAFSGSARPITLRRRLWPDGALVAEKDDAIIGVAIASRWGSLGLFGPLAVHPQHWRGGTAHRLLEATLPIYARWNCRAAALFTFPASLGHVDLYQSFGFWPRSLTAVMSRPVTAANPVPEARSLSASGGERGSLIEECAALTETLFSGLDLRDEIAAVLAHPESDAFALTEGSRITGFVLCHCGDGSEADRDRVYAKFAAVRPGAEAPQRFRMMLDAANDFAHRRGAAQLHASINMACVDAYRIMLAAGFRSALHGVAMHRPAIEIYDRPDVFALEDWR